MIIVVTNVIVKKIELIKFYKLSKYVIISFLTKLPPFIFSIKSTQYLSFPHHLNR
jgi:hypothetical protein